MRDGGMVPAGAGELAKAKHGLEQWRRKRKGREPIPRPLWQAAARAAAVHGVGPTARQLRLNATKLKEWLEKFAPEGTFAEPIGFVELPGFQATSVAECVVEAEDRLGRRLRIQLKGPATTQAVALSRMLWRDEG